MILWSLHTRFVFTISVRLHVSGQQLIFLKFKTKIKSESVRKRVCKSVGFGFVKKWRNLSDSKSDSKSVTSLLLHTHIQAVTRHFLGRLKSQSVGVEASPDQDEQTFRSEIVESNVRGSKHHWQFIPNARVGSRKTSVAKRANVLGMKEVLKSEAGVGLSSIEGRSRQRGRQVLGRSMTGKQNQQF